MSQTDHHIAGIPCIINVTYCHHTPPQPNCTSSDIDFNGETDIEYEVLDRKGYKANWLVKKITDDIDHEIRGMIIDTMKGD